MLLNKSLEDERIKKEMEQRVRFEQEMLTEKNLQEYQTQKSAEQLPGTITTTTPAIPVRTPEIQYVETEHNGTAHNAFR